jgi:hypothetical protein
MDEVITRIVEIERQCAADVEQAELESAKKIEAHQRLLEEKILRDRTLITSAENSRLTRAVEEARKQIEAASAAFRKDIENLYQNPILIEAIKKDIISILLGS